MLTTCDEEEELSEVFWFAKHRAHHPAHAFQHTLVLHIADQARQEELATMYENA